MGPIEMAVAELKPLICRTDPLVYVALGMC